MGIIRPATPGFLTTLSGTVLLIVVTFCVPYFKSVYFLKASVNTNGVSGSITLGTLGYCLEFPGNTTCSKASIGYQFGECISFQGSYQILILYFEDPNKLLGDNTQVQIPQVVVKWLTDVLVLHLVAMLLAAIAAVFGLLAHVREMSMSCFSSCISGFAAGVTLLAFIFDIVFFFVVKSRINKVQGGSATIGNAVWLTLAAWILLFISGCVFAFGRCCISTRGPRSDRRKHEDDVRPYGGANPSNNYAETLRLDAVKAEADRKARQLAGTHEVGLPAFQEYERQPLRSDPQYMEEELHHPYLDHTAQTTGYAVGNVRRQPSGYTISSGHNRSPTSPPRGPYPGGYVGGAPGGRAIDGFYDAAPAPGAQLAGIGTGVADAFAAHHQVPLGGETGQGYPPQQHLHQDMYNVPYGDQPYDHAAFHDPYAPTTCELHFLSCSTHSLTQTSRCRWQYGTSRTPAISSVRRGCWRLCSTIWISRYRPFPGNISYRSGHDSDADGI